MSDYTFIDHGAWEPYTPDTPLPEFASFIDQGIPVVFCRRVGDGVDWYTYIKDPKTFQPGSLKITLLHYADQNYDVAQSIVADESKLFPVNQKLIEVIGVDPSIDKPHKLFEQKVFDGNSFSDRPSRVPAQITDQQFARGLWHDGIITFDECLAFCTVGATPAALLNLINQLPDDDTGQPTPRKEAKVLVSGARTFLRDHPLTNAIGAAYGWSSSDLDAKWTEWSKLT